MFSALDNPFILGDRFMQFEGGGQKESLDLKLQFSLQNPADRQ